MPVACNGRRPHSSPARRMLAVQRTRSNCTGDEGLVEIVDVEAKVAVLRLVGAEVFGVEVAATQNRRTRIFRLQGRPRLAEQMIRSPKESEHAFVEPLQLCFTSSGSRSAFKIDDLIENRFVAACWIHGGSW